jgi:CubicO group peptidase (beta-lactamase class C family)
MRSRINQLAREKQFCGSLTLVQNGEIVARSSFGNANPALSIPNTPETQFNIGSIGKMFTAIAIAKLVEDGKLAYDRPIRESLSALSHCPEYHAAIFSKLDFTPHELLTHTAGLNDDTGKIYEHFLGPNMLSFKRVEDYFRHIAPIGAQSLETRGTHRYSNLGYFLLGLAIEAIEGDYYKYVKEAVFIPAGMTSTVPTRAPGDNFALPTLTSAPSLPNPAPQWLVDMSRDQSDTRLSRDAHFAITMLADIRKITEVRDKFVAEILAEYQKISTLSPAEYPEFRTQLIEKINLLHEIQKGAEALKKLILPFCERLHKQWENNSDIAHDPHLQKVAQLDVFLMETLVRNAECPQLNCFLNSLSIAHPAGCWYSTVDDLIKFDQSFQNGTLSTYRSTLMKSAVPDGRVDSSYGYGCAIAGPVSDPLYHLGHTGGMPGGLANYQHYPNTGYTLVMLSNEANHDHIFGFAHEIEDAMRLSMGQNLGNTSVVTSCSFFQQAQAQSTTNRAENDDAMKLTGK